MTFRTNEEALAAFRTWLMPNYDPAPVAFARGQGARLWDVEGKAYLDFAAGVAVNSLGHSHPRLVEAIAEQARKIIHTSNLYLIPNETDLARRLVELSGLGRAFFPNPGTEAIEAALKLSRHWGRKNGGRTGFVATQHSFHGRSMGALSVTGQTHYQQGFEPLVPGVTFVPYGDADAVAHAITPETCAVVVEPIQGEGGVHVPPTDYLPRLREICDEKDILMVLDEVQTGIGRTGTWFAHQASTIQPDVMALAKGLGGGFPIGAVLCNDRANAFQPGAHGSTFGGNPLATAAGLATLRILDEDHVLDNVQKQGKQVAARLADWAKAGHITGARGVGLLQGFDLPNGGSKAFARSLLASGLLASNIGESTVRLCPPLIIGGSEVQEGLDILGAALGRSGPAVRRAAPKAGVSTAAPKRF